MDNTNYMLFKWLNDKGEYEDIYKLNPVLKTCKQFYNPDSDLDSLNDFQMRFVILVSDPFSPLILLHGDEQKKAAAKLLNADETVPVNTLKRLLKGDNKKVEKAIEFYKKNIAPPKYLRYKKAHEAMLSHFQSLIDTLNHRQNDEIIGEDGKSRKKTPEDYLKLQQQCNQISKDKLVDITINSIDEYEDKMNMYKIDIAKWGIEVNDEDVSIDSIDTKKL